MTLGERIKKYIENTTWYRGAKCSEDIKRKPVTYWTSNRSDAVTYAKMRKGDLIKAKINPQRFYAGGTTALARRLRVYTEYMKLKMADKKEDVFVARKARQHCDMMYIDKDQIAVFNPNIITVLARHKVDTTGRLIGYKPKATKLRKRVSRPKRMKIMAKVGTVR